MVDRSEMTEKTGRKGATIGVRLLAVVLILTIVGALVFYGLGPGRIYPNDVSVRQLYEHPSVYAGQKVKVVGYLVKYTGPHLGENYSLCEGDPRNMYFAVNPCVAVAGPSTAIDRYISIVYDGAIYEVAPSPCSFAVPCRVAISGVFIDQGPVTDASQYVIEASSAAWFPG